MAEPLAVVPALNSMIPLCALLAFGASVSCSPWVVKAVSRTVLLALITLAWMSQPASKIQNLVSQLWGHDNNLVKDFYGNKPSWLLGCYPLGLTGIVFVHKFWPRIRIIILENRRELLLRIQIKAGYWQESSLLSVLAKN